MTNRSYEGPALDATEQWITERPAVSDGGAVSEPKSESDGDGNGETVSGSSREDIEAFEERVVGADSTRGKVIRHQTLNPDASIRETAAQVGCSESHVRKLWREHEARSRPVDEVFEEMAEARQRAVLRKLEAPDMTQGEIADELGMHRTNVGRAFNFGNLLERLRRADEETVEELRSAVSESESEPSVEPEGSLESNDPSEPEPSVEREGGLQCNVPSEPEPESSSDDGGRERERERDDLLLEAGSSLIQAGNLLVRAGLGGGDDRL